MRLPPRRDLLVSIAILVAGWAVGIAIYVSAGTDEQVPFELTDEAKRYTYQLEQSGGQFAVMVHQINDSVAGAFHGAALGLTIGVLASLVALCWFLVARRR